jgi:membrane protein insertase Oxa1/YidC/SpoIIIJ
VGFACVGFGALMHVGMDGVPMPMPPSAKTFMTFGLPAFSFYVMMGLPAATMLYFSTTNVISIGTSMLLKSPGFKQRVGIPEVPLRLQVRRGGAADVCIQA